ncbi:MAG: lipid A-modifier LpxR family protein, partial [Verrucomicrobiota bacterium]
MKMRSLPKLTLILISTLLIIHDRLSASEDRDWGSLTGYIENDLFVDSDSDYTSGVRASYVSPEVTANELPDWLRFLRPLSGDSETWSFLENVLAIEE